MCDYSVVAKHTRDARIGDKLQISNFGGGHHGFKEQGGDPNTAICLKPGTELAFDQHLQNPYYTRTAEYFLPKTAVFAQVSKNIAKTLHDVLEFPDGNRLYLAYLPVNTTTTVLQLPAQPKTAAEAKAQERVPHSEPRQPASEPTMMQSYRASIRTPEFIRF